MRPASPGFFERLCPLLGRMDTCLTVTQPRTKADETRTGFMDKDFGKAKKDLLMLFDSQPLAVLATQNHGQPYASLVAFASSHDLKSLYFATTRSTCKYANLSADPRVAMLVDNRSNQASDFRWAMAATATGKAKEVDPEKKVSALDLYLAKHPHLVDFVQAPTCAICEIRVQTYFVVTRFQHVVEVHITP
jgi:nitroimidazol reductase NimA-like FMN-containing flavoprotein (pyridoxamine 5'-phosphate oxidase superfamily)